MNHFLAAGRMPPAEIAGQLLALLLATFCASRGSVRPPSDAICHTPGKLPGGPRAW
jgi:hypothetical protein